jgi:hypothetical protein
MVARSVARVHAQQAKATIPNRPCFFVVGLRESTPRNNQSQGDFSLSLVQWRLFSGGNKKSYNSYLRKKAQRVLVQSTVDDLTRAFYGAKDKHKRKQIIPNLLRLLLDKRKVNTQRGWTRKWHKMALVIHRFDRNERCNNITLPVATQYKDQQTGKESDSRKAHANQL